VSETPSDEDVLSYFERLSNWGRWGPDDQLGTLNLITPEKRLEAIRAVKSGVSVGCARPILQEPAAADVITQPLHYMIRSGEAEGSRGAADFIGLASHGYSITHVDALSHQFWDGRFYNNTSSRVVTTETGATVGSVETMKDGIVTRGVLLDIAGLRGRPYLDAGEPIFPSDLEEAERAQGVRVTSGDALLIHTGWYERRLKYGTSSIERPGLHAATLPWLHEREVAAVASDAANDVHPSGYDVSLPLHSVGIVAMGLCLIDACQFVDLAEMCRNVGRYSFMFVVAPIRFRYATAAPVTPLAIM
jgi:kynurenine formamidase